MATELYLGTDKPQSQYYDRKSNLSREDYFKKLETTCTIYIGNLSIGTSEDSIYTLFQQCGKIKTLHMGINKEGRPAGFCFIIYSTHEEAYTAVEYMNQIKLEDRVIRVDWDVGFDPTRIHGRGQDGLQIRDCMRRGQDSQRLNLDKSQQKNFRPGLGYSNSYKSNNNNFRNNSYHPGGRRFQGRDSGSYKPHNNNNRYNKDRSYSSKGRGSYKSGYNKYRRDEQQRDEHQRRSRSNSDHEHDYRRKQKKYENSSDSD